MNRRELQGLLYSAEALSLVAALLHLWVTPDHFREGGATARD